MKVLLFLLMVFSLKPLLAKKMLSVNCNYIASNKCLCDAPDIIQCGKDSGYIKPGISVKSLKILVTDARTGKQKVIKLDNPPGKFYDYKNINNNPWVKSQLRRQGVRNNDLIEVADGGFELLGSTKLYESSSAKKVKKLLGDNPITIGNLDFHCWYNEVPSIIQNDNCTSTSKKVCIAQVQCNMPGRGRVKGTAACLAKGQNCPLATACANSDDVHGFKKFEVENKKELNTENRNNN